MTDSYDDELKVGAEPVARHEAGHMVVAKVLGFDTGELRIQKGIMGGLGGAHIFRRHQFESVDEIRDYLERRIQVLCAGALAEHMEDGQINVEKVSDAFQAPGTAGDDWAKVSEDVHVLCGIIEIDRAKIESEWLRVADDLAKKAAEIVQTEEAVIDAVAKRLVQSMRGPGIFSLSPAEIADIPEIKERFP